MEIQWDEILVQQWLQEHKTPEALTLERLVKLIDVHFTEHKPSAFYAEQLNLTTEVLNKLTRFYLGKTVYQLLQERLLLVSKHLLCNTLMSVKDITYQLGFEDPGYFCRWFKRMTGMKAKEWRRGEVFLPEH